MKVCIVGTGYVGLVTAACLAEMGNTVRCVDVNPEVVETLKAGRVHIYEPGLAEMVARNTAQKRLFFTTDLAQGMDRAVLVFICVGTPSKDDGTCDLSFVRSVAEGIGRSMNEPKVVVNKSTVPVGTADMVRGIIRQELDSRGSSLDFDVVSNPEFLKEGDAIKDFMKPDRVIIGTESESSAELLSALYAPFARSREKVVIMGVRSAEMTKYAANCMLATKISFINEVANICEKVGADVGEVRLGIGSDSRIGYSFIYPGVGYGGSCFPKDVKALIGTARAAGYEPDLISAVDEVNARQKSLLGRRIIDFMSHHGGPQGKTVALWGIAFKPNTDDIREAPSRDLIALATGAGMRVRAFDPVAGDKARQELGSNALLTVVDEQYEALSGADVLAVVTEWNQFRNPDFDVVKEKLKLSAVFDGRNLYRSAEMDRLGLAYFSIGRSPRNM